MLRRRIRVVLATAAITLAACGSAPSDRRSQVDALTEQIRPMPGVIEASNTFGDGGPQGPAFFEVDVAVGNGITGDHVAAIASRYLDDLKAVDYTGYRAELDVRSGDNVFLVDSGGRPVSNRDQIVAQAHSWVALRQRFPGSTITLRAAINHADGHAAPSVGSIQLPDTADYTAAAAAVDMLATSFGDLAAGDWTVSAGKQHPAEIRTSRRLPNAPEMDLWNTLNADQSIPHADVFTINGAVTGRFWVSEKIPADDPDMAVRLAQQHLPIVAQLPAPVVYTASNQYQGHIDFYGNATGPVTITIGGCTVREYPPSPAEQALIDRYETCGRPVPR